MAKIAHFVLKNCTNRFRDYTMGFNRKRRVSFPHDIYQVVVNGEDGEYAEYEVEADSYAEATAMAENLAADSMINISYIEVYLFQ